LKNSRSSFLPDNKFSVQERMWILKKSRELSSDEGIAIGPQPAGKRLPPDKATEAIHLRRAIARKLNLREVIESYSLHRTLNHNHLTMPMIFETVNPRFRNTRGLLSSRLAATYPKIDPPSISM
jgi:hypothetical protein